MLITFTWMPVQLIMITFLQWRMKSYLWFTIKAGMLSSGADTNMTKREELPCVANNKSNDKHMRKLLHHEKLKVFSPFSSIVFYTLFRLFQWESSSKVFKMQKDAYTDCSEVFVLLCSGFQGSIIQLFTLITKRIWAEKYLPVLYWACQIDSQVIHVKTECS